MRSRQGLWLHAGNIPDTVQQASSESPAELSNIALPLVVLGGVGLLLGTLGATKLLNSEAKVSVLSNVDVKFQDVPDHASVSNESKEELELIVAFLKKPEVFQKLGAKVPKSVLLSGPGNKALMAQAIAGESGVPFLEMASSGSQVHDVFAEACEKTPCVLFIPLDRRRRDEALRGELVTEEELEDTIEPLMSEERLDEILQAMEDFKNSELVFVVASSRQALVDRISNLFALGVAVGREPEGLVARRLLAANRLEEAVEAYQLAYKGCTCCTATEELEAELKHAQELLEQHWEKYHDMNVPLPRNGTRECSLRVRQSVACDYCSLSGGEGPGGAVSAAGLALASYVSQNDPPRCPSSGSGKMAPWCGVNVLELGSGTGIAGIAAASAGANVLLTDRISLLPLMAKNIELNQDQIDIGSADCAAFEWADVEKPGNEVSNTTWDVVLGADLVSEFADVPGFADAMAFLLCPLGRAAGGTAIYAHHPQSVELDEKLQSALTERGLNLRVLPSLPLQAPGDAVFWELRSKSSVASPELVAKVLLGGRDKAAGLGEIPAEFWKTLSGDTP